MQQTSVCRNTMLMIAILAGMAFIYTIVGPHPHEGRSIATRSAQPSKAPSTFPAAKEAELNRLKSIIDANSADVQAMTNLANSYYDTERYEEAIVWYHKILEKNPSDVNISTDLGTALWYLQKPDDAIAQFNHSLEINPDHPQTLFNLGIVKLHGKNDAKGAIVAWERLLRTSPNDPRAAQLKSEIEILKKISQNSN